MALTHKQATAPTSSKEKVSAPADQDTTPSNAAMAEQLKSSLDTGIGWDMKILDAFERASSVTAPSEAPAWAGESLSVKEHLAVQSPTAASKLERVLGAAAQAAAPAGGPVSTSQKEAYTPSGAATTTSATGPYAGLADAMKPADSALPTSYKTHSLTQPSQASPPTSGSSSQKERYLPGGSASTPGSASGAFAGLADAMKPAGSLEATSYKTRPLTQDPAALLPLELTLQMGLQADRQIASLAKAAPALNSSASGKLSATQQAKLGEVLSVLAP